MRILCVTTSLPVDLRRDLHGLHLRLRTFLDGAARVAAIDLLAYVGPERDDSAAAVRLVEVALADAWGLRARVRLCRDHRGPRPRSRFAAYLAPALDPFASRVAITVGEAEQRAFEAAVADAPDAIFLHRLASAFPALRTRATLPPLLLDLDDLEHVALYRELALPPHWPAKPLLMLQIPALALAERRAVERAAVTFVCSEHDRRHLARWLVRRRVEVFENSVALPAPTPVPEAPTLLFLGRLSYAPNRAAADLLVRAIWPRVHRAVPEARLIIAGSFPEEVPARADAGPGVEFPGFVDDLDALYARTRVVCCPIYAGSGTRIKLIEAAAYGRPIVSTTVGAEGLALPPEAWRRADTPAALADACIHLLRDHGECRRLGEAARRAVAERYDRSRAVERIAARFAAIAGRLTATGAPR